LFCFYFVFYFLQRIIEKTKVTCIKWLPGSQNLFLVSHASGHMYLYSEDVSCAGPTPPTYQLFKQGQGFSVWTCKAKSTRNPLYRCELIFSLKNSNHTVTNLVIFMVYLLQVGNRRSTKCHQRFCLFSLLEISRCGFTRRLLTRFQLRRDGVDWSCDVLLWRSPLCLLVTRWAFGCCWWRR